jgi:sarcosine oxidase
MSARFVADVIVIGLGAFGSAVACQLARRGAAVIGIDRFHPPHDLGSSHGATRITRLAVGEGAQYVPFVQRSHQIWRVLESELGQPLHLRTGGLIMGSGDGRAVHHGRPDFVQQTIDVAQRCGIAHEVLRAADIRDRYPQFLVRGDELAYCERDAGVLLPERCVAAQIESARAHGATLRLNEPVLSIRGAAGGVTVRTGAARALRAVPVPGVHLDARRRRRGLFLRLPDGRRP